MLACRLKEGEVEVGGGRSKLVKRVIVARVSAIYSKSSLNMIFQLHVKFARVTAAAGNRSHHLRPWQAGGARSQASWSTPRSQQQGPARDKKCTPGARKGRCDLGENYCAPALVYYTTHAGIHTSARQFNESGATQLDSSHLLTASGCKWGASSLPFDWSPKRWSLLPPSADGVSMLAPPSCRTPDASRPGSLVLGRIQCGCHGYSTLLIFDMIPIVLRSSPTHHLHTDNCFIGRTSELCACAE